MSIPIGSLAELATAVVALVAVILSALALGLNRAALKNSDLLRVHDRLVSADVQAGRRLLQEVHEAGISWSDIYRDQREDFDKVNHAVSVDGMMAQYVRLNIASKRRSLDIWGARLVAAWPAIEGFIRYRRDLSHRTELWHELVWLGTEAGAHVTIAVVDLPTPTRGPEPETH